MNERGHNEAVHLMRTRGHQVALNDDDMQIVFIDRE